MFVADACFLFQTSIDEKSIWSLESGVWRELCCWSYPNIKKMWNISDLESMKDTSQRPIKKSAFLFLRSEITVRSKLQDVILWSFVCFFWLQKPWIHGDQRSVSCPKKRIQSTWFGRSECASVLDIYGYIIYIRCLLSCVFAGLAGTLWPEGSGRLGRFPHWFRHQTGQGWVWILRRVESSQLVSQGDMRNEMGCKMKTRQSFQL